MKQNVEIPLNKTELLDLVKNVQAKHLADGETSLLKALDWPSIAQSIESATTSHDTAIQLQDEVLRMYQQRDLHIDLLTKFARDSRDILTGTYSHEMRKLTQWGFKVTDRRNSKKSAEGDESQKPQEKA